MSGSPATNNYVQIDEKLCNGCVLCMKACPTKAIRVKEGRIACIEGNCIYCGECIRVCPRKAVKAVTLGKAIPDMARYPIMVVSPVLYGQFGEDRMPNEVLTALRRAFTYVYDGGYTNELCNLATELYFSENRLKKDPVWPLISPNCPVVNRIISYRFHSLLQNLLPITTPRELSARYLKERLLAEGISDTESIGVYSLTPCAAEMISIKEPILLKRSYLDGALGINEIYTAVKKHMRKNGENAMLHHSGGIGMGWGMSGGEISGLNSGKYLAISGIQETIRYLEKIEMGLLDDLEYVEFRACPEGCVGGPMTAADRYQAKHTIQRLVRMFGVEIRANHIQEAYKEGWFFSDNKKELEEAGPKPLPLSEALKREERIEQIMERLPGKECGACGSPDCRTFAEDVVDGRNSFENCVFLGDVLSTQNPKTRYCAIAKQGRAG